MIDTSYLERCIEAHDKAFKELRKQNESHFKVNDSSDYKISTAIFQ